MRVMVTFRHVNPSAGLRSYASEKVERLEKFARRILEAHVILSVEKNRHRAEIQASGKDIKVTATEETGDLYSAIDLAVAKVQRQLKRQTEKRNTRKGRRSAVTAGEAPEPARPQRRLRARRVALKPISVEDALLQIESDGSEFVLFRNADNELLSVVYRRKDGGFGLIEPEPW